GEHRTERRAQSMEIGVPTLLINEVDLRSLEVSATSAVRDRRRKDRARGANSRRSDAPGLFDELWMKRHDIHAVRLPLTDREKAPFDLHSPAGDLGWLGKAQASPERHEVPGLAAMSGCHLEQALQLFFV